MPTRSLQSTVTIDKPILSRWKSFKGDLTYEAFISDTLDLYEKLDDIDNKVLIDMIEKYQKDNPEFEGKLNALKIGLMTITKLAVRDLKHDIKRIKEESREKKLSKEVKV